MRRACLDVKWKASSTGANHMGTTCGLPSAFTVDTRASLAAMRKAAAAGVIDVGMNEQAFIGDEGASSWRGVE